MPRLPLLIPLLLLPACSSDDTSTSGWIGEDLPACSTTNRAYLIDQITLPLNSSEAEDLGADLDGDGTVDNQGGNIISAVINAITVDLQGAVDEALAADLVQVGVSIDTCAEPGSEYALVSLVRGVEVDRTSEPPRLTADQVTALPAVAIGGLIGPAIDGTTQFPAAQLLHPSVDEWIDAALFTVVIDDVSDAGVSGHLAAALDGDVTYDAVSRAFHAKMIDKIDELGPCTETACDEVVRTMLEQFDEDGDGAISLDEVKENYLTEVLLRADVDTGGDGEEDALSVGVGFHASPVTLYLGELMTRALPILLVALSGCTLYTGSDGDDALPACATSVRAFRIDALDVPASAEEARSLGADLDGDRDVDNQGGSLIAAVDNALDVDLQGAVDEALQSDLVQIGVTIEQCEVPLYDLFGLVRGVELDRGTAPPTLLAEQVTTEPAVSRDGFADPATGGLTQFPVGQLIHPAADRWIDAAELVVQLDEWSDDAIAGRLVAALDHDDAYDVVARGFQAKLVEREAELGPCTPESCDPVLRTLYDVFDFNGDGVVTLPEIKDSSLFMALLAPDLDLDDDGTNEHLSIGVGFRASRVDLELR